MVMVSIFVPTYSQRQFRVQLVAKVVSSCALDIVVRLPMQLQFLHFLHQKVKMRIVMIGNTLQRLIAHIYI